MKNLFRILGAILLIILIHSCKKDKSTPPVITTSSVTEISYTTATSGGDATNEGGATIISKGICWNTSVTPTIGNSRTTESGGLGAFTSNLTQLTQNTLYYVRAYATNSAGTGYGNQVTFTTSQIAVPVLTTTGITSIKQTTAASGGNISADNGGSVTARGVCWGTVTGPTTADSKTTDGTDKGSFVSNLTGLIGNTTYYVRAYATNSAGTQYGNQISFLTSPLMPTLTTAANSLITNTSCTSGGNISSDGGAAVTAKGICWSTSSSPTIAGGKTTDGTGSGSFVSSLTGLTPNTTYYVRAYATNSVGTAYGDQQSFTTDPVTVTDIDGNIYDVIRIGTQLWTKENLNVTKYNNGDPIPNITDALTWDNLTTGAFCDYNNTPANSSTYGKLYNWYAVNDPRNLCPTGWYVASDAEWTALTTYLGGENVAGGYIKEIGTTHWISPNIGATNDTGFSALPGGARGFDGSFYNVGMDGIWWSSIEYNPNLAWDFGLNYNSNSVYRNWANKYLGLSVRCIKR